MKKRKIEHACEESLCSNRVDFLLTSKGITKKVKLAKIKTKQ